MQLRKLMQQYVYSSNLQNDSTGNKNKNIKKPLEDARVKHIIACEIIDKYISKSMISSLVSYVK